TGHIRRTADRNRERCPPSDGRSPWPWSERIEGSHDTRRDGGRLLWVVARTGARKGRLVRIWDRWNDRYARGACTSRRLCFARAHGNDRTTRSVTDERVHP